MNYTLAQQPEISVIVPVRNGAECVGACIKALQKQTMREIEFIFVDDASTDSTCRIIRKAALQDSRITLIEQEKQGGPGQARNRGIDAARGRFIGFVDADDSINPEFYNLLIKKARNTQAWVVKGSCTKILPSGQKKKSTLNENIRAGLSRGVPLLLLFNYEHWTGLYQRDFVNQIGARNGHCRQGEDNIFLMQVMCHLPSDRFATEDTAVYYYQMNEGSVSIRYDADFLEQSYISLCLRLEYMATQPDSPATHAFIADQFEEKIYHRVMRVWESLWLNQIQLHTYLKMCLKTIQQWVVEHPNNNLQSHTRQLIESNSIEQYIVTLRQDESIRHKKPMPKNELKQFRRDVRFLLNEKQIIINYWRYKLLSVIHFSKKTHYQKQAEQSSLILKKIKQMKQNYSATR